VAFDEVREVEQRLAEAAALDALKEITRILSKLGEL
jgi:hypothetical protein